MGQPSKEQIKERAKYLREILREKHKIELPHGHSLEVIAKVFGFKDWNTASAFSVKTSEEKTIEKPITANFQKVGELKKFLDKFDDETKLVVNEYSWSDSKDSTLLGNVTSICSLTYDYEIQNETELCLELKTESEHDRMIGKSSSQSFDKTSAGRSQRRIKYLNMLKPHLWNLNK